MKNLFFIITLLSSVYSFGQFPPEFPKKLINKVFCGTASTSTPSGSIHGKHFLDFPYRLTIYEDSLFVEYNPGERWKEDKWGRTQTIKEFKEWKREPRYNSYGDLTGHYIHYRIPYGTNNKYSISSLYIYVPTEPEEKEKWGNSLSVSVTPNTYQETSLNAYEKDICQTLKSKSELLKEEAEKKRLEEERIKLENQKKELDKITLQKINDLLSKNALEDAAKEYSKLNFENSEIKEILQQKLDDKFGQEVVQLNPYNVEDYIKSNTWKINNINPGNYSINFDKSGWPSNMSFPSWSMIPKKEFGSFTVYLKSLTEINIIVKDSILVSSTYSTNNEKPLYIDKNENFYFKTKTGLPVATISNNPLVDKKLVKINKVYKREKYANGILIHSYEFKTEKTVGIMKKDQ